MKAIPAAANVDTPPENLAELEDWARRYLRSHRAQQYTINGFTYPFVHEMHFGALPYPSVRKYSMLAGLFASRPGDLFFMFQGDPQWPDKSINTRSGLRGVYRVESAPFADDQEIKLTNGYSMLGQCPSCHAHHGSPKKECPNCGQPYPEFTIPDPLNGKPYRKLNMHLRLELAPLIVFERGISDERAYGDMSDPQMIWIGRHDNSMGIGKRSSVRQLLPEEAVKIVRLFVSEPGQKVTKQAKAGYPNKKLSILNEDGSPAENLRVIQKGSTIELKEELMLNFDIARTLDMTGASIQQALGQVFVPQDLEYFSSEFPWGYTASTSDFVCTLAKDGVRYRIILMEFKKGVANDNAVIQVMLYVPWVVQVLTQFADPKIDNVQVVPLIVGRKLSRNTCVPRAYSYSPKFVSGASPLVKVESPMYIEYSLKGLYTHPVSSINYATAIEYTNKTAAFTSRVFAWTPPSGASTSQEERKWVKDTSWKPAKKAAGF